MWLKYEIITLIVIEVILVSQWCKGNRELDREKRVKRAFGLIVPDSYRQNQANSDRQSILLQTRNAGTNDTLSVLELYRSFEQDPGHSGRNLPRWLQYSIHHDPNQITSVSTRAYVPPTSRSLFNLMDVDETETTSHKEHEIQEDSDDEAYYYSDLDINSDALEEGPVNVQTLDHERTFSQLSNPYNTYNDVFKQNGRHSQSETDNVQNEISTIRPLSNTVLTTQRRTTPSSHNSITTINSGSDECCSNLTIKSTGWANDIRTSNWGDYKYYSPHNGRKAYKHNINDRFLYWSPLNTWMVSGRTGWESGYIQHIACTEICPELCDSSWQTYERVEDPWTIDERIEISCENFKTTTRQPTLATSLISQTTETQLNSPTSFVENEQDVNNLSRQDRRRRIQSLLVNPRRRQPRRQVTSPGWNMASNRQYWIQSNIDGEIENIETTQKPESSTSTAYATSTVPTTFAEKELSTTTEFITVNQLDDHNEGVEGEVSLSSTITSSIANEDTGIEKEGQIRLVDGRDEAEGNVQIFHNGQWGTICDDEWDLYEAKIACVQLGFPGAKRPTHSSQFGYGLEKIWMDNMHCYGTEDKLTDCRFEGWGVHDCERTEAAGVQCKEKPPPTTPTPPPTTPRPMSRIHKSHGGHNSITIRLTGGRNEQEGRVEVSIMSSNNERKWNPICGDGWGVREAMVVCRELGLHFAQAGTQTDMFNPSLSSKESILETDTPILSGVSCNGNERRISECHHHSDFFCPGSGKTAVAAVVCVEEQADLVPDLYALMSTTYLEDKHLFFLQCAMEENCLASEAYRIRRDNPDFSLETRRLLRFTTSIENIGNADFRPNVPKSHWVWHGCHQHYHSMEIFAHYELLDHYGKRVSEGQKASFCLEDNDCNDGVEAVYDCENYGDQGITPGCKDIYHANIDCQWLDVTELPTGTYTFKLSINPEYKVAEQTFENNAALCTLHYTQQYAMINNCTHTRP